MSAVPVIVVCVTLAIILSIVLVVLSLSCFIVRQAEAIVIERLGRFHKVLNSGLRYDIGILNEEL